MSLGYAACRDGDAITARQILSFDQLRETISQEHLIGLPRVLRS